MVIPLYQGGLAGVRGRHLPACLFAALIAPAVASPSSTNVLFLLSPPAAIETAHGKLTDPRTAREGERLLQQRLRGSDADSRAAAAAVLATHYRRQGTLKTAAALVMDWADMAPANLHPNRLDALLEHARCEAASGHTLAAIRILDYAREQTRDLAAALVAVAYADVVEMAPDYEKAVSWVQEAITLGDRWARPPPASVGAPSVAPAGAGRWPHMRTALADRLKRLQFEADAARWGMDCALYRYAQQARQAAHPLANDLSDTSRLYPGSGAGTVQIPGANNNEALLLYDRLIHDMPDSVFAEAARLYRTFCLVRLNRVKEAQQALDAFSAANPMGLYRGEALLVQGDIHLQAAWDPKSAAACYAKALQWCDRISAVQEGVRRYAVPPAAAAVSAPPEAPSSLDAFGVICRTTIPAGAVVNRLTAPWYLDRLRAELYFRIGFLSCLEGNWEQATTAWANVARYDPVLAQAKRQRILNPIDRLAATRVQRFLVGQEEENRAFPAALRTPLWWADFLLMRESFDAAGALYERLFRTALARGHETVAARAALGWILRAQAEAGRLPETAQDAMLQAAHRLGSTVLQRCPNAPATPYVAFLMAYSLPLGGDTAVSTAQAAFRQMAVRYPRSRHAVEARFWEAFTGLNANTLRQRMPLIDAFLKEHRGTKWSRLLEDEVTFIREHANP